MCKTIKKEAVPHHVFTIKGKMANTFFWVVMPPRGKMGLCSACSWLASIMFTYNNYGSLFLIR